MTTTTLLHVDEAARVAHAAIRGADPGQIEDVAWRAREGGVFPPGMTLVESGIHRGEPYSVVTHNGASHVVKRGDWLVSFALEPAVIAKKASAREPWVVAPVTHVLRTGSEPPTPAKVPGTRKRGITMDMGQAVEEMLAPVRKQIADAEAAGNFVRAKDLRRQMLVCKMQVNEHARERDLGALARLARGQGVPLLKNSQELPEDDSIQYR